jgi:hypothetical protein
MVKDSAETEIIVKKSPFRRVFDALYGNTVELKKDCSSAIGIDYRTLNRYYNGDTERLNIDTATQFIEWANKNRVPNTRPFTVADLLTEM